MIQHSAERNYKMVPYSNTTSSYMALGRFNEDYGSTAFSFSSLLKISSAVAFSLWGGGGGGLLIVTALYFNTPGAPHPNVRYCTHTTYLKE